MKTNDIYYDAYNRFKNNKPMPKIKDNYVPQQTSLSSSQKPIKKTQAKPLTKQKPSQKEVNIFFGV